MRRSSVKQPSGFDERNRTRIKTHRKKIQSAQVECINPEQLLQLLILPSLHSPTGVLTQQDRIVEWIFLPNSVIKMLSLYVDFMAQIILKGHECTRALHRQDPSHIILPLLCKEVEACLQNH